MALEAQAVADANDASPSDRRAKSERRGKDRRQPGARINRTAPRRSVMKVFGVWATGLTLATFVLVFLAATVLFDSTPWMALSVTGIAVVVSVFALMLGCIEQRLIEIRLELMMANGGSRQADRRGGDRRGPGARLSDVGAARILRAGEGDAAA